MRRSIKDLALGDSGTLQCGCLVTLWLKTQERYGRVGYRCKLRQSCGRGSMKKHFLFDDGEWSTISFDGLERLFSEHLVVNVDPLAEALAERFADV